MKFDQLSKENVYVKLILPRKILSDKKAKRNNRAILTKAEGNGTTKLKSPDGLQCNLMDTQERRTLGDLSAGSIKKHDNQAIGVSRGGKNTKVHFTLNTRFKSLKL